MRYFFALLLLLISIQSTAQKYNDQTEREIRAVENSLAPKLIYGDSIPNLNILDRMITYNTPGLSIAVVRNYQLVWARGYGWADTAEKRKVTSNTRFQAASISKSLNSLALLKLVQQRKIDLDADINQYLKDWKFPYDSVSGGKKISLANLLSHTAGLSVHGFRGYKTDQRLPTIPQILDGKPPSNSPAVRSLFAPGLKFQYSGGGTTITQLLLTDLTGRTYEEFMAKEVLGPIGMTQSFFTQPPAATAKDLATAYNNGKAVKGKYHVYPEQAAAGLWTNPTDLAKYIIETQRCFEGKSSKVISSELMRRRLSPMIDSSVGLGVFLMNFDGERYFSHSGGNEGFLCNSFGSLEGGNGVIVMINGNNFGIIDEVINSVARVYQFKNFYTPVMKKLYRISNDTLSAYTGTYKMGPDTIYIKQCGENLCLFEKQDPTTKMTLLFTSSTEFELREAPGLTIRMIYKEGKADEFELNQGDRKTSGIRIQ